MRIFLKISIILFALVNTRCERLLISKNKASNSPHKNFEYLWSELDKKYSYFELKKINWDSIKTIYNSRIDEDLNEYELFEILNMQVAIYGRKITKLTLPAFTEILETISSFGWGILLEEELSKSLNQKGLNSDSTKTFSSHKHLKEGVDLMISVGGDGTFLKSVDYVRDSEIPVLGINTGRLGFLANVAKDQIQEALSLIKAKKYIFQKRSLLIVHVNDGTGAQDFFAMNELALHKKDTSSMITVKVSLDGNFLNSYWSDGLIVSTPTGSTAYNLSCGGPIVTPGCQVHIVTPIAPHNLNVRPMVIPDHMPITLNVEGRGRSYLMSIDGKSRSIKQGQEIVINKAAFMINVIKFENNNFLDTIRNKMLWGIDKRN